MTLPDLRKFAHAIALADTGSFIRASERVNLSQPALTRSIQVLEKELGVQLFDRTKQGVKPTRDGQTILNRVRALLRHGRSVEHEIRQLKEASVGDIAFGLGPAISSLFLPQLLMDFNRKYPDFAINVFIDSPLRLLDKLNGEDIEFFVSGIQQLNLQDSENYRYQCLGQTEVNFFARRDHPLAKAKEAEIADLKGYTLATTQVTLNSPVELKFEQQIPKPKIFCNDLPSIRHLLLNSDTVMFGLDSMVAVELEQGTVCRLSLEGIAPVLTSNIGLVALAHRTPSKACDKITTWIESFFKVKTGKRID